MKHICSVEANHFLCAGLGDARWPSDTDNSHYSFAVFGVDPEDFSKSLEELFHKATEYPGNLKGEEVVLRSGRMCDTIRMTLDGTILAITRGNLKVLYHGYVGTLSGLPKVIRKAVQVWERKLDKELV